MCSRAERKRRRRRRRAALGTILVNGKPCRGTIEIRAEGEVFEGFAAVNCAGQVPPGYYHNHAHPCGAEGCKGSFAFSAARTAADRWPSDGETDALRGPRVTELYRAEADGARSGEGVPLRVRRLLEEE